MVWEDSGWLPHVPIADHHNAHFAADGPRRVSFNLDRNSLHPVATAAEYQRQGEFDPDASHAEWEKEEVSDTLRAWEKREPDVVGDRDTVL